jgi:hypothetical protein
MQLFTHSFINGILLSDEKCHRVSKRWSENGDMKLLLWFMDAKKWLCSWIAFTLCESENERDLCSYSIRWINSQFCKLHWISHVLSGIFSCHKLGERVYLLRACTMLGGILSAIKSILDDCVFIQFSCISPSFSHPHSLKENLIM